MVHECYIKNNHTYPYTYFKNKNKHMIDNIMHGDINLNKNKNKIFKERSFEFFEF